MYLNKALIIGNLTRDPELKALPSGSKVASFSLATNRTWKDQAGARQEATEYHNVVAFGRTAEVIAQYCKKGSSIYVEGRIQTRSWDGPDGQKRYRTEVVADRVQFGARPTGNGSASTSSAPEMVDDASDMIEYPTDDINPDDIPF
mgnify:CR=1 FL=1